LSAMRDQIARLRAVDWVLFFPSVVVPRYRRLTSRHFRSVRMDRTMQELLDKIFPHYTEEEQRAAAVCCVLFLL
jgi:hypothetical protein